MAVRYLPALCFVSAMLACSNPQEPESYNTGTCVRASDCEVIGMACDKGRCVAALSAQPNPSTEPAGIPKIKVKPLKPFDLQTSSQDGSSMPTKIPVDPQVSSVPITELGIGGARLGMTRSEWFSVPNGEFAPAEPGDPPGVDARGLALMDGVRVVGLFKGGILCQLSTKHDHAATMLGLRPGDPAYRAKDLYGAISSNEPRFAEKLKGVFYRFRVGETPVPAQGDIPDNAVIDEIFIGTCM